MDSNILKASPSVWLQGCRFVANPGVMEDMLFSFYSTSESGQLVEGWVGCRCSRMVSIHACVYSPLRSQSLYAVIGGSSQVHRCSSRITV